MEDHKNSSDKDQFHEKSGVIHVEKNASKNGCTITRKNLEQVFLCETCTFEHRNERNCLSRFIK